MSVFQIRTIFKWLKQKNRRLLCVEVQGRCMCPGDERDTRPSIAQTRANWGVYGKMFGLVHLLWYPRVSARATGRELLERSDRL